MHGSDEALRVVHAARVDLRAVLLTESRASKMAVPGCARDVGPYGIAVRSRIDRFMRKCYVHYHASED
jgi:hypothetical protein